MNKYIKDKVKITTETLWQLAEKGVEPINEWKYIACEYKKGNSLPEVNDDWKAFSRGDRVQGRDKHFWFYTEIKTPAVPKNHHLFFELATGHEGEWDADNPQGILYLNGKIAQGLDVNHRKVFLEPDTEYKIYLYFYVGMKESYTEVVGDIKVRDIPVYDLYYNLKVPYDATLCFNEKDYEYITTMKHLDIACNYINFRNKNSKEFYESITKANKYLQEEYYKKECGNSRGVISYIGHTHIDVAWLWTLAQTREKVQRTFSTVLTLMSRYPEYVFMSSQPQLYEYLKEEEPELYEIVKEKVREGRWEVEGAMWLEADCNLSSGESLVRQILYGKGFMKKEFDVDSHILWLPDVFGYSAALPQILKKSGVDKFVTSKISWNESNKMPVDTFMWEGIDGTEIFTYFLSAQTHPEYLNNVIYTTYNGTITPEMNLGTWENYQHKEYTDEAIVTFGWGDGGGGPTEEMLENYRRLQYGLPGMPKAQMSKAADFLDRVENDFEKHSKLSGHYPKWKGELYLELHRGTYTSIGKNKKNNRQCEFLCQETETLSVLSKVLFNLSYPANELHSAWKILLLNQFHDILPGSSILEVYEDCDEQYGQVRKSIGGIKNNIIDTLAANMSDGGIMIYNPNSFAASGYVDYENDLIYAENIPPMGWKVIEKPILDDVTVSDRCVDSKHYTVIFDENYNIQSIYDKDNKREVIKDNFKANVLRAFEDYPRAWDNWEISNYYTDKAVDICEVSNVETITGNGYAGFEITRTYYNSVIKQKILLYTNSRRIDFKTDIDWNEHHTVLKAVFPVDIHTDKATYDIQFGNIERPNHQNTSWEAAKFEVCAQKWADISEEGYGVSLLNDCKYGHSVQGNEMTITLLKCGTDPNPKADIGHHSFTYSLYPHSFDFKHGGTINEAYLLNRQMTAKKCDGKGKLNNEYSLVKCDAENIIIETVKQAENGKGIVVRLYDAWNKKADIKLDLAFAAKSVYLCDMMENPIQKLDDTNDITLKVKNFEIVSILIEI